MENFDYKPNSHKVKNEQASDSEEKRVSKVVSGNVKVKKKSEAAKLGDTLKDGLKDAKTYLVKDVLIPSAKKLFVDLVKNGADILAYGSAKPSSGRNIVDKVSFREAASRYWDGGRRADEPQRSSRFDYDEIKFDSRGDAERVLDALDDMIATYGYARVSDIYDCIGVSCDYTYNNYGWEHLGSARVVGTRDGFVLDLPRVIPLRR